MLPHMLNCCTLAIFKARNVACVMCMILFMYVSISTAGFPISAFRDLNISPAFFAGSGLLLEGDAVSIVCSGSEQSVRECDVFPSGGRVQPTYAGVVCVGECLNVME